MELRQLEAFVAIADAPSMGKAAESLHVSQPSLSGTLKRLETDLGCTLFDRVGGRLHLNETGRMVLPRARLLLEGASQLEHDAREMGRSAGALRVTFTGFDPKWWFEPRFSLDYSDVDLRCTVDYQADVEGLLHSRLVDAVVAGPREGLPDEVVQAPFLHDRIVLAVPESSKMAGKRQICVRDERPPLLLKHLAAGEMHRHTLPFWKSLEPQTKVISASDYFEFVQLLRTSDAPAISTAAAAQYRPNEGRVLVPTTDPELAFDFFVYYLERSRKKLAPLVEWVALQAVVVGAG